MLKKVITFSTLLIATAATAFSLNTEATNKAENCQVVENILVKKKHRPRPCPCPAETAPAGEELARCKKRPRPCPCPVETTPAAEDAVAGCCKHRPRPGTVPQEATEINS
jgi:hypothetical protein